MPEILKTIDQALADFKKDTNAPIAPITEAVLPLGTMLGNAKGDYIKRKTSYEISLKEKKKVREEILIKQNEEKIKKKQTPDRITDAELVRYAEADEEVADAYQNMRINEEIKERLWIIHETYVLHINSLKSDRNVIIPG